MRIQRANFRQTLILFGAVVGMACATVPAPKELTDARVAYVRVSQGPAAQVDRARLQLAKEALDDAEMAYGAKPEQEVRDRSYLALRRIQAAEQAATAELATQRRHKALLELATMQGAWADKARAELASAENRVAGAQARAQVAEGQVVQEQARTETAQQQTLVEQQRADSERQARLAAEARANQALADLSRMANVKREQRGLVITLSGQVLFTSGEATLLPAATKSLDNVVAALKAIPANAGRVAVEGHTDARGTRAYNRDLAERRARSVRDYLVSRGLPLDLFVVEGVGPDRPVASNSSAEGRANNRRVEIVLPPAAFASVKTESVPTVSQPATTATSPRPPEPTLGQTRAPSPAPTPPTPVTTPPIGGTSPRTPYPSTPTYPPSPVPQ